MSPMILQLQPPPTMRGGWFSSGGWSCRSPKSVLLGWRLEDGPDCWTAHWGTYTGSVKTWWGVARWGWIYPFFLTWQLYGFPNNLTVRLSANMLSWHVLVTSGWLVLPSHVSHQYFGLQIAVTVRFLSYVFSTWQRMHMEGRCHLDQCLNPWNVSISCVSAWTMPWIASRVSLLVKGSCWKLCCSFAWGLVVSFVTLVTFFLTECNQTQDMFFIWTHILGGSVAMKLTSMISRKKSISSMRKSRRLRALHWQLWIVTAVRPNSAVSGAEARWDHMAKTV